MVTKEQIYLENENVVAMSTIDANKYRIADLLTDNWVICRLCDSLIYLHTTDQSQCIKQLQCIIIYITLYNMFFIYIYIYVVLFFIL